MQQGPLGWYVRVTTSQNTAAEVLTKIYIAGFSKSEEAVRAVKLSRNIPNEHYEAIETVIEGRGPQVNPQEVREIPGAI